MRKIAFCVVAIILMLSTLSILAEVNEVSHDFLFRGINWWVTEQDFDKQLTEDGFYAYETTTAPEESVWTHFYSRTDNTPYNYTDIITRIPNLRKQYGVSDNRDIRVAGYKVSYVVAEFLPSYNKETLQVGAPYRLVRAGYAFSFPRYSRGKINHFEAYADFEDKLTLLYGEPTSILAEPIRGILTRQKETYWRSDDGSAILMSLIQFSSGDWTISIDYGFADDSAYVNDIIDIYEIKRQDLRSNGGLNTDEL